MTEKQESQVRAILEIEGLGGDDPETGYDVVEKMINCLRADPIRLARMLDWKFVTGTKQ